MGHQRRYFPFQVSLNQRQHRFNNFSQKENTGNWYAWKSALHFYMKYRGAYSLPLTGCLFWYTIFQNIVNNFFSSTAIFQIWSCIHDWSGLTYETGMSMDLSSFSFLALSCGYAGYILINQIYTYQLVCEWTSQKKVLYAVKNIFAVDTANAIQNVL